MKATEQYFPAILLIILYNLDAQKYDLLTKS